MVTFLDVLAFSDNSDNSAAALDYTSILDQYKQDQVPESVSKQNNCVL